MRSVLRNPGTFLASLLVISRVAGAAVPESRDWYNLGSYRGIELVICFVPHKETPNETRVLALESGIHLNTNQEFIYKSGGDFAGFTSRALNSTMTLAFDTAALPAAAGTRTLNVDGQDLEVAVSHQNGYSHVSARLLDKGLNRTPKWIPSGWGGGVNPGNVAGYRSERHFFYQTLQAVLEKLVSGGSRYLPDYYVVTYSGLAEVVVPLKYKRETQGRELKPKSFSGGDLIMFGVSLKETGDPDAPTKATVGSFGLRVDTPRELNHTYLMVDMKSAWSNPMYVTLDTPKPLPVTAGIHKVTADGQDLEARVWNRVASSHVVIKLPGTYQRSPHYWPDPWGGARNPRNYPGYAKEKPFCARTVREFLKKLVAGDGSAFEPRWYSVSYASKAPALSDLDPDKDISFQATVKATWVIPQFDGGGSDSPPPANQAPQARLPASPTTAAQGEAIGFDGAGNASARNVSVEK